MKALTPLIKFYDEFCVKNFQVEELRVMNKIKRDKNSSLGMHPLSSPYIQEFKLGDAKPPHSNNLGTKEVSLAIWL